MDAEQQGIPRSRRYKLLRTTRVERSGIRHSARHVDNAENDENDAPNQGPSDSLVGPTIHLRDMARVLFSWVIPETFQQQEAELNASIELGRNQAMGLAPQVDDMQGDDFAADSQQSDHSSAGGMDMEVWQDDNFDPGDMGFPNNETQQTSDTHVPTPSVDLNATENAGPLGGIDTGLPELPLTANSGSSSSGSSPRMVRHTQPLVRYDYPVDWDIMPHRIRHLERREAELLAMVNDLCEEPTRQQLRSKEEELARLRKTLERLHLDNHYAAIHQSSQEVLLNRLKSALTARTAGEKRAISSSHDYQRLASSMTSQMMEFESLLVEERTRTEELEDDLKESRALCDRKDEENKEYHRKAHHALNLANARKDDLLRLDRSLAESRERIILRDRVISDLEQGLARANADILSLQTSKESLQTNLAHTERQLEDARKERRRVVERLYADIDHHQAQQSALQDLLKLSHAEHSRDMKAANLELKSEKVRRDQLQCQYSDLSEQLRSAQEELSRTTKRRLEDVELDEQIERLQAQKRSRRQGSPGKAAGDVP
ncbi:hypothetical protein BD324DRAFT_288693 [Kockovaella imperatae]|uniref:Uncharacterized protein n=1 Tax=Kockovaella imperatae TaxID=4999 RepID=A0A1Y1U5I3_9TREE|nr:hypothetical protein BD324DRAFT_288693 [Kockovaella imperatae]ORX33289.1 hypothetical protein BD324DRAFT_288693 [Kockovaella imperatae]